MSYQLDNPIRIGAISVSVISRMKISRRCVAGYMCFACEKKPVAVLTLTDGEIGAQELSGAPITPEDLSRLYPDMPERFRALCATSRL